MDIYKGWNNIPAQMSTKTKLRNEFGLKPCKGATPQAQVRAQTPRGWKEFDLYHVDDCVEIKKRKVDISRFGLDDQTIADALYIINKSAKVSRDTKKENYHERKFRVVSAAKTRQLKLYKLKDEVIERLVYQERIILDGYHEQNGVKLLVYRLANRSFHIPMSVYKQCTGLKHLGEINGLISSDRQSIKGMNFNQAVKLLEKFLNEEIMEQSS